MVQSQEHQSLTIGRLAQAGGVGVETIRFYQRKGLIGLPPRASGVRRYGSTDVRRLRFVRQAQGAGFSLAEIRELLDLDATEDRPRVHTLALTRIAALDQRIAELKRARESLSLLAQDCADGTSGPCPILAAFER